MNRLPIGARRSLAIAFCLIAFTLIASHVFLYGPLLLRTYLHFLHFPWLDTSDPDFAYPQRLWLWWTYLIDQIRYHDQRLFMFSLLISATVGGLPTIALIAYLSPKIKTWDLKQPAAERTESLDPPRSASSLYGNDRLMTIPEQLALWSADGATQGYILVGEVLDPTKRRSRYSPRDSRSWGRGGTTPLLKDACTDDNAPHVARFGGTGSGKTSVIISDGCCFRGGMVFLDPSIELAPVLARTRIRMGHDVVAMATERKDIQRLKTIPGLRVGGTNAVAHIPNDDPEEAEVQSKNAVEWVCGYTPEWSSTNTYFTGQGKDLVLCLLADMLADPTFPPEIRNLASLRMMISDPALPERLERIYLDSASTVARSFAGELYPISQKAEETWMSIYTTANAQTRWISYPRYARLVCGDEFSTDSIPQGNTDLFICLPLDTMIAEPAVARCIIGATIGAIKRADGDNDWIVMELEEAAQLRRMKELESLPHVGRKYRIKAIFHYQTIQQPEHQFGKDGLDELIDSCRFVSYMATSSHRTGKHIEDRLGTHGAVRWSQSEGSSQNSGAWGKSRSRSTNYSEMGVPVRRASAIATLPRDAQIVISGTGDKAITGIPVYYRRPEFVRMVDRNRFIRSAEDGNGRSEGSARCVLAASDAEAVNSATTEPADDIEAGLSETASSS